MRGGGGVSFLKNYILFAFLLDFITPCTINLQWNDMQTLNLTKGVCKKKHIGLTSSNILQKYIFSASFEQYNNFSTFIRKNISYLSTSCDQSQINSALLRREDLDIFFFLQFIVLINSLVAYKSEIKLIWVGYMQV